MFRYQHLIRTHMDELAALITEEQGKTLVDAKGDVFRGLEVVEFACGAASHSENRLGSSLYLYAAPVLVHFRVVCMHADADPGVCI